MQEAADWGVAALERAAQGLTCTTAVHICYGYGIKANVDWKATLGERVAPVRAGLPGAREEPIDQVSLECIHSHVPPELMRLLEGKDVMVGVIDVACDADRDARGGRRHDRPGAAVRARGAADRLHQLRPGADATARSPKPSWRRWRQGAALARRALPVKAPFAAPITPPGRVAATLAGQGHAVLDPAGFARLVQAPLTGFDALRPSWGELPPDTYLRDGGHYRRRRHSCFIVRGRRPRAGAASGALAAAGIQRPARRPRALVRADRAGRVASPPGSACCGHRPARARGLRGEQPWYVEAHQFRIDTTDGIGRPTPEGAHRDGVDLVAVLLVGREGIKGGETRVFDGDGPTGMRFTMQRAVDRAAARRRARDPREHADPADRRATDIAIRWC